MGIQITSDVPKDKFPYKGTTIHHVLTTECIVDCIPETRTNDLQAMYDNWGELKLLIERELFRRK